MKKHFFMAVIAIFSSSSLLAQKIEFYTPGIVRVTKDNGEDASKKVCKRLHDDVLHISKKPLRGELSGFLSICQAEASCISPKVY